MERLLVLSWIFYVILNVAYFTCTYIVIFVSLSLVNVLGKMAANNDAPPFTNIRTLNVKALAIIIGSFLRKNNLAINLYRKHYFHLSLLLFDCSPVIYKRSLLISVLIRVLWTSVRESAWLFKSYLQAKITQRKRYAARNNW